MGWFRDWRERPCSARRLHERYLFFVDETRWKVSLLPFFRPGGVVESVVVVRYDKPGVYSCPVRYERFRRAPIGVLRSPGSAYELEPLARGPRLDELEGLWHYDPWWILRREEFAQHETAAVLRTTNCVHELPPETQGVEDDHALTRVVAAQLGEGETYERKEWNQMRLPERQLGVGARGRAGSWVLDPPWSR